MKILCLIDSLVTGGAQRQLVNLAIMWKKQGYDIDMLCYGDADFYEHYLKEQAVPLHRLKCRSYLDRIFKVRKYIRRAKPDFVISFLDTPNFLACVASIGKHNWKLITNERNAKVSSFVGLKAKIFKFFERYSDWTVCNSQNGLEMWKKYCPQYAHRLSTIYNLINVPDQLIEKTEMHDRRRIVIAASYMESKNLVGVVNAVALLSPEIRQCIVIDWYGRIEASTGNTEVYDRALQLIEQYNLSDSIRLHSETKQIYREMATADGIALFSHYEGLPNVICEGLMLSKPILMSRVSDYDVLVKPENGFLCDSRDIASIASVIERFALSTDEELRTMGRASKDIAQSLLSSDSVKAQWNKLFFQFEN